ncbi:uncharacterized protein HaLaN_08593 [Haematococcus lacustris]|uniref:Tetratricopeptide SHNi-TPR domain-containing protein n=1 Tax=Haematococcus lacustris TaxID=44745 RepID=A0A699Z1D5_HAELA|nr:uncharacterized protein HaLaN_08593 [Haematococcus lacustris]
MSAEGAVLSAEQQSALEDAAEKHKQAKKLINSDPEEAADLMSRVLEVHCKTWGEEDIKCAQTYLDYSRALLEHARASSSVLGDKAQKATADAVAPDAAPGDAAPGKVAMNGEEKEAEKAVSKQGVAADEATEAAKPVEGSVASEAAKPADAETATAQAPAAVQSSEAEVSAAVAPASAAASDPPVDGTATEPAVASDAPTAAAVAEAQSGEAAKAESPKEPEANGGGEAKPDAAISEAEGEGSEAGDDLQEAGQQQDQQHQASYHGQVSALKASGTVECELPTQPPAQPQHGGADSYASELAEVHLILGDCYQEREQFAGAVEEYEKCEVLLGKLQPRSIRRLAECHFSTIFPLQLQDILPEALGHCRAALKLLEERCQEIRKVMDTPVEGETGPEVDAQVEALEVEQEELQGLVADIKVQEEELQALIQQRTSMKDSLKSMMQQIGTSLAGPGAGTAAVKGEVNGAMGANGVEGKALVDSSAVPMGPTHGALVPASNPGPVRDLGKAGRGRSRITLQPLNGEAGVAAGEADATSDAAVRAQVSLSASAIKDVMAGAAQKRRLEEVLGGPPGAGGVTTVGFGIAAALAAEAGDAKPSKRVCTDSEVATPAVPTAEVA